jgi:ornithine cyclodeaminase/alanine dehydrogenase-like protein (mu-crystallin family)
VTLFKSVGIASQDVAAAAAALARAAEIGIGVDLTS